MQDEEVGSAPLVAAAAKHYEANDPIHTDSQQN